MKIRYLKIMYLILILIIIFKDANALTQVERDDLNNKIAELKDNKESFENLLKFLDENFSLNDEPEIVNILKINAQNLDIDISKYPNIFVQAQVSKQNDKQKNTTALKLILILIILLLIVYLGYLIKKFIKMKKR